MRKLTRTSDRAAVAKSLRELQILFGEKRPPDRNENAQRELGAGEARTLIKGVTK